MPMMLGENSQCKRIDNGICLCICHNDDLCVGDLIAKAVLFSRKTMGGVKGNVVIAPVNGRDQIIRRFGIGNDDLNDVSNVGFAGKINQCFVDFVSIGGLTNAAAGGVQTVCLRQIEFCLGKEVGIFFGNGQLSSQTLQYRHGFIGKRALFLTLHRKRANGFGTGF